MERKIPRRRRNRLSGVFCGRCQECARLGLTTVHDAGVEQADIDGYQALIKRGQMPMRVYAMVLGSVPELDAWLAKGPEIGDYLTVRSIKLVADGALGSRGAAMLSLIADDPGNRGTADSGSRRDRGVAEKAVARGFQLNTHAIGDAANRAAIEAYGAVLKGPNDKRFRVEHAQVVAPEDFAKFKQYSVIASMQATHATSDMPWAEARLGPERIKGAYAWQTFMKLGVHVPTVRISRWKARIRCWGLYSAITRQDKKGNRRAAGFRSSG